MSAAMAVIDDSEIHLSFPTGWLLFRIDTLRQLRRLHLENRALRRNAPSLS
jgi:hypothetical protein